jgi:hypothetical protein
MYCGADIPAYSKGSCEDAEPKEERRRDEKLRVPRILFGTKYLTLAHQGARGSM